jgi:hypothetical protein
MKSIGKILRHGQLSPYRITPKEHAVFMVRVKKLDQIVKSCMRDAHNE